jgi:TrmH family RNA methyltransferase
MISKNQIKFIRQLEQKKFRRREGVFVAEGTKVVGDLLQHYHPNSIFATEEWLADNQGKWWRNQGYRSFDSADSSNHESVPRIQVVTSDELSRLSFQQHPQQVLAIFPLPDPSHPFTFSPSHLSIALDGIQDPGNLGTIIRIADWFGIRDIFCSEDTVDAWNPKVVQATMGSIARVNIIYISLSKLIESLPDDFPVYGTLLDGENIYSQQLTSYGLIVMGNEGNGISPEIRQKVNHRLLIPSFRTDDTAESLNVAIATAITCSEFRRQLL